LTIQVLDDSTDGTTALARARVAHYASRGAAIRLISRAKRKGYKAGALAHGLKQAPGEFIAVFDADFVPAPDFLRRVMPHFDSPDVGVVQARWGHLNAEHDPVTRAQALLLDGHFVVEQSVRFVAGLFLNFNGSAGVWRRECIEAAGGWASDTVAEDLDLSYRAQLLGWRIRYLPEVLAPAEIPPHIMALKRQQARWAKGSIQCLRKLGGQLARAPLPLLKRVQGLLHLSAYLMHPAMLLLVLSSLPVVLSGAVNGLPLGVLGLAGFGAPIMFAVAQWAAYPSDWLRRFAYFFYIMLLGSGLALNNTWAMVQGLLGRSHEFLRTPKFRSEGQRLAARPEVYALPADWTAWGELALSLYSAAAAMAAWERAPALAPFLAIYAVSFGYTAATAWWQASRHYSPARALSSKSRVPPVTR
jgi:cellulose synthase/poly-beta-1,6-N-acetylglucosamine synthase-like glycosyltransferase